MAQDLDVIIVGQGLAGTTLAWHLREAGQRVLLLDADDPGTSSRIAAGLITPITGKRIVPSWRWDDFLPAARSFYTSIEQLTGNKFFHERIALRLFQSDAERENWSRRATRPDTRPHLADPQPDPLLDTALADTSHGGFAMKAAQLNVTAYLEASRDLLDWEAATLDWENDVQFSTDKISVLGYKTRTLISCEGFAATNNPHFKWVPSIAAKGDILTLRFQEPLPPHSLHRGIWVAPTKDRDIFHVGSTYDWDNLEPTPDASARAEIESKLRAFLHVPYSVLEHRAAVRPIISESRPLIGMHPEQKGLGYFNGLGSKGSLLAPWYARCFTNHLVHGTPVPGELDVGKHF